MELEVAPPDEAAGLACQSSSGQEVGFGKVLDLSVATFLEATLLQALFHPPEHCENQGVSQSRTSHNATYVSCTLEVIFRKDAIREVGARSVTFSNARVSSKYGGS